MTTNDVFHTPDGRNFKIIGQRCPHVTANRHVFEFSVVGPQTNTVVYIHMSEQAADRVKDTGWEPEEWLLTFGLNAIKNTADEGSVIGGDYYLDESRTVIKHFQVKCKLSNLLKPIKE